MNLHGMPDDLAPTTHSNVRATHDEILDPLTGELISTQEKDRLAQLHRRLEDIALELLSTCRQIRAVISPDPQSLGKPSPLEWRPVKRDQERVVA